LSTPFAVATALLAALVFGISSVADQRSTKRVKTRKALSPRILLDLVRQPLWVIAVGATVAGFALQVVALDAGSLALVEPLLVCDLVFAVLITRYLGSRAHVPPIGGTRGVLVMFAGVAATTGGVAGFLVIGQPTGGSTRAGLSILPPLAAGLLVVVGGCLAVAARNRNVRPLALALACGVSYGVAAFVVKLMTSEFSGGLADLFTHWPIYALAVVGPVGFVLNQNAFQQGTYLAPVQAILTAADPVVSIGLGIVWLNVRLNGGPAAIFGEVASLLLMTAGIYVTAHHFPHAAPSAEPDDPVGVSSSRRGHLH
jgi:hypothetical protein